MISQKLDCITETYKKDKEEFQKYIEIRDALKEAGIDFTILKINKRGEAMQISQDTAEDSRNVQNLKKKRKRMIDDLFEGNKRSRLEVLQAATTSFMMKPPEPEHMQGGEMETD